MQGNDTDSPGPFLPSTSLAKSVLDELLVHVERLSSYDHRSLDDENVAWIPRLGLLKPKMAFREIQRVLEASYTVFLRLERAAWLYCWMLPRRKIRPWLLLRFGTSALHADCATFLAAVTKALRSDRLPSTLSVRNFCGTYYVCLISKYPNPSPREYAVMFLVLWSGKRFAAAYARTGEEQRRLATAIHVALFGESVQLLVGLHADLDAAFCAGVRGGGTHSFLLERNRSITERFLAQPDPQQRAVDHSLAMHSQGETP